jgi:hypothetical protein
VSLQPKYEAYAAEGAPTIEFLRDSIFEVDWSDASFIFANSTCFSYNFIERLSQTPCKQGTFAMSLTRPLLSSHWTTLESVKKPMSWGEATIYIQVKGDEDEIRRAQEDFARALDSD